MAQEAKVATLILSALFHGGKFHFTHELDKRLDEFLPYLYCVLVRRGGTQTTRRWYDDKIGHQ